MTINQILTEYELYPHSKDHYDLLKEETELALMEMYIEDQKFIMENAELIKSTSMLFEEASMDSLKLVQEAAEEKSENLFTKIWNGIKKAVTFVVNAFKKLFAKIFKSDKQLTNFCATHEFTQEEFLKILKLNDSLVSLHGIRIVNFNSPSINVADNVNMKRDKLELCSAFINFAIGNVVQFNVKDSDSLNQAVSIDRFISSINSMDSLTNKDSAAQVIKDLSRAIQDNDSIPVDLYSSKSDLGAKVEELEGLLKILNANEEKFKKSTNVNNAYKLIVAVIPPTVKFYNAIITFHTKICELIRSFM